MTLEQRVPWLRDITCLAIGAGAFIYSVANGASWPPLLVSAGLMAGPGVLRLVLAGLIPGSALSSEPASSGPPPPSPPPSSVSSAGERR